VDERVGSRTGKRLTAVVVVVILVMAGVGGYLVWSYASERTPSNEPKTDGPTFYQALAQVNTSVQNTSGGPWSLFSVYGIANVAPFSAGVIGFPLDNITTNACGAEFNGVTLWNGTIPVFDGSFESGTAPFWQFGYFSNTSREILLATSVLGAPRVYAPIPFPSECQPWYDFPSAPAGWASMLTPLPPNSPIPTEAVVSGLGQKGVAFNESYVEIMTLGPGVFNSLGDGGSTWGVYFDRCGLPQTPGIQPLILAGVSDNGTNVGYFNETINCALVTSGNRGLNALYHLDFSTPVTSVTASGIQVTTPFQVAIAHLNGTLTGNFDGWGLATWMVSANVSNSSGAPLPIGLPSCPNWVPNIASCVANDSGWFVVLLSAGGQWLGAYGLTTSGPGWTLPVWTIVSHQQLVIVTPPSWNIANDSLILTSTVSASVVHGNLLL